VVGGQLVAGSSPAVAVHDLRQQRPRARRSYSRSSVTRQYILAPV